MKAAELEQREANEKQRAAQAWHWQTAMVVPRKQEMNSWQSLLQEVSANCSQAPEAAKEE